MSLRWACGGHGAGGRPAAGGGCELINAAEEPTDLYTITPKSTFDAGLPAVFWQLAVEVPAAAANLNTGRIAHRPCRRPRRTTIRRPPGPTARR